MWVLLKSALSWALLFTSGIGAGHIVDKFVPGQIATIKEPDGKFNWFKIGLFVLVGAIGIMIVKYIGKKMNIKLLK